MSHPLPTPVRRPHATQADLGPASTWGQYALEHPILGHVPGKLFLGSALDLTGAEISVGVMEPGAAVPFLHTHRQNEEIYLFLGGSGEFQVDGEIFPVREGSVVRVAPAGRRCWRNTGADSLVHLVIQVKAGSLEQATLEDGSVPPDAPVW